MQSQCALHVNQELGRGGVLSRLRIKLNVRSVACSLSSTRCVVCVYLFLIFAIFVLTLAQLFAIVSRGVNQR
jgi:hypothetical protein